MSRTEQGTSAGGAVMDIADVRKAIAWQAEHLIRADAPNTARVIRAELAILETDTALARRIIDWQGLTLGDALPLRVAAGLHHLVLSGEDRGLEPVYGGDTTDQDAVDAIVADLAIRYDERLLPWLDGPPQTNEAGRSASIMAGLLWLSGCPGADLGARFALYEIGASAGINTMMARYKYDLGGVQTGPRQSAMSIVPEWRGDPPPPNPVEIVSIRGCDIEPVDLADPEQALRLKAYIWPDARQRMARMDVAIALAATAPPNLVRQDAADFVRAMLAEPQEAGVTRTLFHTIMWQYLPDSTRDEITAMMGEAGSRASAERPLAWLSLETNRQTFNHELHVRYWPHEASGISQPVLLAQAHPHGAWVEWFGPRES